MLRIVQSGLPEALTEGASPFSISWMAHARADHFSAIAGSAMKLDHRTLEQSAVTTAIWGVPVVSVNAMRHALLGNASRIVAVGEAFRVLWRDHRRSHHTASRDKQSIP